jgi:Golgi phosphoprotein 3
MEYVQERTTITKKRGVDMLDLNIPEKLFVIAIEDERGKISVKAQSTLPYGLAGAFLAELALAHKIYLDDNRLGLADAVPTGDGLSDEILANIAAEEKHRRISHWVDVIGRKRTIRRVAERLAERGAIRIEKKRFLWVIPYEVYPRVDASAKFWVKQHLRAVVFAGEQAEPQDIALLSLLKACGLLGFLFTQDERKLASQKVGKLVAGEPFGRAVSALLAEIEAAAAVAAIAATSS